MLILHGVAGGLDELVIAVVAIGVLWLAVKLAGRKPTEESEEAEEGRELPAEERADTAAPTR
jgi:hypothetical protein